MADRVEEVGLAQADASVEEDGVIDRPWRLGDGLAGRPSELVGGADHERLERVARRGIVGRGADGTLARGDGGALWLWVDLDGDARVPAEYRAGGGPDRVDVMVCDPVAGEGVGRADVEVVAVQASEPAGTQPRCQGGFGNLPLEGRKQARPQRVKHARSSSLASQRSPPIP